jgi:hypothetical protein
VAGDVVELRELGDEPDKKRRELSEESLAWPETWSSVVDRGSDSPVESSVVHLPSIGQAEHNYYRKVMAMFYIFLSNITMRRYNMFLL